MLCTMFLHIYAYVYMCVYVYTNTDNYTHPLTLYIHTRISGVLCLPKLKYIRCREKGVRDMDLAELVL